MSRVRSACPAPPRSRLRPADLLPVGVVAGLYPALRAARLAPTDALRSV